MKWIERVAKENVDLLTKKDTIELFEDIATSCNGNVSEACKLVGIERKTYYNWKENVKSITPDSKIRVLIAALKNNMTQILDKLATKSFNKTCRLLYLKLSTIHEKILESEDIEERINLVDEFISTIAKFDSTPVEHLNVEINDMLSSIKDVCPNYNFENKILELNQRHMFPKEIFEFKSDIYTEFPNKVINLQKLEKPEEDISNYKLRIVERGTELIPNAG